MNTSQNSPDSNPAHPSEPSKASLEIVRNYEESSGFMNQREFALLIEAYAEQVAGERVAHLKATDALNFGLLKEMAAVLLLPDESYTLLPEKLRTFQKCYISEKQAKIFRGNEAEELRSQLSALKLAGEQAKEALGDVISLADEAMKDANRDCGEYDRVAYLKDARETLASLTLALSQSVAPTQAGTRKEGETK